MSGSIPSGFSTNVKTQSGNRLVVEFAGMEVGLVQSVRMSDNYGLEPASGIGDIHVIEHVPSRAVHTISVTNMVLFTQNMRDLGIAAENGDMALLGLVFDIVLYPKEGSAQLGTQPLRAYKSCSYDSGDVSVDAHRIVMQSGQFRALDVTGLGL